MSDMYEVKLIGDMKFCRFQEQGWKGWVLEERAEEFTGLEEWLEGTVSKVVLKAACRRVERHASPGGAVYSKLMWAQNDGAYQNREIFSWLKWSLGPSRAVHILDVSAEMMANGFQAPRPLLAVRRHRPGGWHWNLLITEEVQAPTLEELIGNGSGGMEAVSIAGRTLAQFHRSHFVHGDFLPRNTCLEAGGRLVFLDNDKTFRTFCPPLHFLSYRNLDQFTYNLMLLGGLEDCHEELPVRFLESYAEESGREASRLLPGILGKARQRWSNKQKRVRNRKA